ncbi:MAG: COX15/CtaA family protein [Cyclobacteriaceae bacterium]|nr:COX15/CtaA family protein [Cyclobacteriaceae bacterium]
MILVGGVVRSTGSGMGCPDWPTCFGQWIPPTSVDQLPPNYKTVYSDYRHNKNVKFARYLSFFGMDQTAHQLLNDEDVRQEADFNAAKTWVEYMNRLTGVAIGLFIIALFWRSIKFRRSHPKIFLLSLITLLAVIFQGWFGSIVVSTNLTTWTITLHMFIALVIVAILFYLLDLSKSDENGGMDGTPLLRWILGACMVTLFVQIFLGTNVREMIDQIASTLLPRNQWIDEVGPPFLIHRAFSWLVVILHLLLLYLLRKTRGNKALPLFLIILILGTLLTGTGMAYFSVPAFLQPIHLVLATITFGLQLHMYFNLNTEVKLVFDNVK